MSSILDALKKLEREEASSGQTGPAAPVDSVTAAAELYGRPQARPQSKSRSASLTIMMLGGLLVAGVSVGVLAAVVMNRVGSSPPQDMARLPVETPSAAPVSVVEESETDAEIPAQPEVEDELPILAEAGVVEVPTIPFEVVPFESESSAPAESVAKPESIIAAFANAVEPKAQAKPVAVEPAVPKEAPAAAPEPEQAPEANPAPVERISVASVVSAPAPVPVLSEPEPDVVESVVPIDPPPAPRETSSREIPYEQYNASAPARVREDTSPMPERRPAPTPPAAPLDGDGLNALPMMSEAERIAYGLPEIRVNFVGTPHRRQPRPSAIINMKKVEVGQTIHGTRAILIGVGPRGIGLEIDDRRYFYSK